MLTPNPRIVYAKMPSPAPDVLPVVGEHIVLDKSPSIDLDNVPLNGGFLTKTLILTPEPFMSERMRDPSVTSYTTSFIVGTPVVGFGLVKVLRSEKEGIKPGDLMYGSTIWEHYTVQPYVEGRVNFKPEEWAPHTFDMDSLALQVVPNPNGAFPLTRYCSVLGTAGLTAYVGFMGLGKAKEGERIFVSSGASAVGSMVVQLAKQKGMTVIASAGSEEKVKYMKSIGADFAFNYKTTGYTKALTESGPFDLYWDNVGGGALEAAIQFIKPLGRIICCGSSADYGKPVEQRDGIKNTTLFFKKRLTLNGFIVPDFIPQYAQQFFTEVPALVAQGKIISKETIIKGFDDAPQALIDQFKGYETVGKAVVVVDSSIL